MPPGIYRPFRNISYPEVYELREPFKRQTKRAICTYVCPAYDASCGRGQLKCDGTRAETRFRLSAKRTSPFKSARASVQSTTGSQGVRISGSNAGYNMFRGNVKGTGYPLHSPVSPSLPLPCGNTFQLDSTILFKKHIDLKAVIIYNDI